jgi:hypothetical protein
MELLHLQAPAEAGHMVVGVAELWVVHLALEE